jgi:hypothetical protein
MMDRYRHLSAEERALLWELLSGGMNVRAVAAHMKRHPSTLYREIKRNYAFDEHREGHTDGPVYRRRQSPVRYSYGVLHVVHRCAPASTALRPNAKPCSPACVTQPKMTSSIDAGSMPDLSINAFKTSPAMSAGCQSANAPCGRQRQCANKTSLQQPGDVSNSGPLTSRGTRCYGVICDPQH